MAAAVGQPMRTRSQSTMPLATTYTPPTGASTAYSVRTDGTPVSTPARPVDSPAGFLCLPARPSLEADHVGALPGLPGLARRERLGGRSPVRGARSDQNDRR